MIQKIDTSAIVIDALRPLDIWCAFEHQVVLKEGDPPTVILVGACKLSEVYRLQDGKMNSEWADIFKQGGSVLVRIVALSTDKPEIHRFAQDMILKTEPTPICNLRGYNLQGRARGVICLNNSRRYNSQMEAAADLGISASGISRHLRGDLSHVGGLRFIYASGKDET